MQDRRTSLLWISGQSVEDDKSFSDTNWAWEKIHYPCWEVATLTDSREPKEEAQFYFRCRWIQEAQCATELCQTVIRGQVCSETQLGETKYKGFQITCSSIYNEIAVSSILINEAFIWPISYRPNNSPLQAKLVNPLHYTLKMCHGFLILTILGCLHIIRIQIQ